ncbi:MAG: hypothetical protein PHI65_02860 [Firmicutes bacterium]|nr:hypothetical protein [Bacillota bacterium]
MPKHVNFQDKSMVKPDKRSKNSEVVSSSLCNLDKESKNSGLQVEKKTITSKRGYGKNQSVSYYIFGISWLYLIISSFFLSFSSSLSFNILTFGLGLVSFTLALYSFEVTVTTKKGKWEKLEQTWLLFISLCIFVVCFPHKDFLNSKTPGFSFVSIATSAMLFKNCLPKGVKDTYLKYLLSWTLALLVVSIFLSGTEIWQNTSLQAERFPQRLQLICQQNAVLVEAKLPKPEIESPAVRGQLIENKIEVFIVPYSFYKEVRSKSRFIAMSDRYEAVLIPQTTEERLETYYSEDTLRLVGQNVNLKLIKDIYGPLLNYDKETLPVLVLQDVTFQSITSKALDTEFAIFLWETKKAAAVAMVAYSFIGFEDNLSSNILLKEKLAWTIKVAISVVCILLGALVLLSNRCLKQKGSLVGSELWFIFGISVLEAVILIRLNSIIDLGLPLPLIGLCLGGIFSFFGLSRLKSFEEKSSN